VNARQFARLLGAAVVTTWAAPLSVPILVASASAASCPDVEVTFARATTEPPECWWGRTGICRFTALTGWGSVRRGVSGQLPRHRRLAPSASAGASDASAHVQSMAANCPNTRLVLGGYSQGAMVIDLITIGQAPVAGFIPASLPADVADHVAAVAVFGNPTDRYLGGPISAISPWYGAKAIDLCAPGDPICTPGGGLTAPTHDEMFSAAHLSYPNSGMPAQAATFAASHL
jgi:cutinase